MISLRNNLGKAVMSSKEYIHFTSPYNQKSERETIKYCLKEKYLSIKHLNINISIENLDKISKPYERRDPLLIEPSLKSLIIMVKEIERKVEEGNLLTLEDLKRVREILQPGYLPLQERYLRRLEQALKVDVERKREVYAKEHGVEWDATLDPQIELKRYSTDLPLLERIKICLRAEAYAEFSLRDLPLWREFFDEGKISYDEYNERSVKIFQEIFGALKV
jgi:hypothetical protein